MIFQQFEVTGLSHYSYAVGCNGTGEIAIIDPKRDMDTYLEYARQNDYSIKYVLETHIHADYASGAKELAEKTGAELSVSTYDKGETFHVTFPHTDLKEGDRVVMGNIELEVLHTPGHTPEHISFLLYDMGRDRDRPLMMFSGDFLFIGSAGRPDLLGEDAKTELSKKLYHSLTEKIKDLPDGMEIYPAHGAGSLCGAGMSSADHSTLGLERKTNEYLNKSFTEEEFVEAILSKSPPFPEYYKRMKRVNSEGPISLNGLPGSDRKLSAKDWAELVGEEEYTLDLRNPLSFGGGHIPGAVNVQQDTTLSSWAPWVIGYDKAIYLVADKEEDIEPAIRRLVQVGLDRIKGYMIDMKTWIHAGHAFARIPQTSVRELSKKISENDGAIRVLDVRSDSEWESGHIPGAKHIYLGYLNEKADELGDKTQPVYTVCGGGFRSSIAASLLQNKGFTNVINTFGGMTAWKAAGLELTD